MNSPSRESPGMPIPSPSSQPCVHQEVEIRCKARVHNIGNKNPLRVIGKELIAQSDKGLHPLQIAALELDEEETRTWVELIEFYVKQKL